MKFFNEAVLIIHVQKNPLNTKFPQMILLTSKLNVLFKFHQTNNRIDSYNQPPFI